MSNDNIMTTRDLSKYIKLNEKTVIKMAQSGKLPGVKIGNQWRFELTAINKYLQGEAVKPVIKNNLSSKNTQIKTIHLSRLISQELIDLDLKAANIDEVLVCLSRIAREKALTCQGGLLLEKLREREKMMSTAVGNGVAVPHPRNPGGLFKNPNIVLMRSKKGINFNAPDGKEVFVVFMICAPDEFKHLRLLSEVARLLQNDNIRERFLFAESKQQIMQIFLEFDRDRLFDFNKFDGII